MIKIAKKQPIKRKELGQEIQIDMIGNTMIYTKY